MISEIACITDSVSKLSVFIFVFFFYLTMSKKWSKRKVDYANLFTYLFCW